MNNEKSFHSYFFWIFDFIMNFLKVMGLILLSSILIFSFVTLLYIVAPGKFNPPNISIMMFWSVMFSCIFVKIYLYTKKNHENIRKYLDRF